MCPPSPPPTPPETPPTASASLSTAAFPGYPNHCTAKHHQRPGLVFVDSPGGGPVGAAVGHDFAGCAGSDAGGGGVAGGKGYAPAARQHSHFTVSTARRPVGCQR